MIQFKIDEHLEVRPMLYLDLPEVKIIRDQCLEFIHDNKSYTLEETQDWFMYEMVSPGYLTVLYDGDIIGYFRLDGKTTIGQIYVGMDLREDMRGRGIAVKVYNSVMEYLNSNCGIKTFILRVLKTNIHAFKLYKSLGFVEIDLGIEYGMRKDYK